MAVTYCKFSVEHAGNYSIIIRDYNKVSVKPYAPRLLSALANENIPPNQLSLIVKEYASRLNFIFALT